MSVSWASQDQYLTFEGVSSASLSWFLMLECFLLFEVEFRLMQDVCEGCHQTVTADCCPSATLRLPLQVWSLEQPDWHCKIDEGSIGLVSSRWSPDGRHILNTTEFHVSVKLVRACIHVHGSVFMHMLVWFQLLLARKEGGT